MRVGERPYRPSNGEEGEMFREAWCFRCKREAGEEECEILSRTFFLDVTHPNYPKEWVYDPEVMLRNGALTIGPGGARCTAFDLEEGS